MLQLKIKIVATNTPTMLNKRINFRFCILLLKFFSVVSNISDSFFPSASGRNSKSLLLDFLIAKDTSFRQNTTCFYNVFPLSKQRHFYNVLYGQRQWDNLALYVIGYWNPESYAIPSQTTSSRFAGKGLQRMIVWNHSFLNRHTFPSVPLLVFRFRSFSKP